MEIRLAKYGAVFVQWYAGGPWYVISEDTHADQAVGEPFGQVLYRDTNEGGELWAA
jgi:hypothetical protein